MKLFFKLAWRNIWRNRRRTMITMASVVMAVLLATVMGSMQQGQYDQMIHNTVGTYVGHMQVQHVKFREEPMLEHSFETQNGLLEQLWNRPGVLAAIPRLDSYALAAGENRSRAALVSGIDPLQERSLSRLHERITEGEYFYDISDDRVIVAAGLAEFLNISVGDSLVLIGQGYRGVSANGIFEVGGIARFGIPEMNNGIVYLTIEQSRLLYGAYDKLTSIAILIEDSKELSKYRNELSTMLNEDLVIHDWTVLMPELVEAINLDYSSNMIVMMILYMVVGFGILGTVLMMTAERRYEFGVMIAIGTSRFTMAMIMVLEMLFLALVGMLTGMLLSLPVVYYFNKNPLHFTGDAAEAILEWGMEPYIRFSMDPSIFVTHALIVMGLTLIISLYPITHMYRIIPVKAMRH